MSPHTAGGDGNVATVSWQEQFNRLRDADGQAFEAGGIRPSTCPVPGTKRVSGNAWGKPWHGEACQSASWQDRSLPVVWQEQTPFSTAQRSSTEASWGRRTKPPSSKYYNYSCLDSLEPDIDEFSMQQASDALVFTSFLIFPTTLMQLTLMHTTHMQCFYAFRNTGMLLS